MRGRLSAVIVGAVVAVALAVVVPAGAQEAAPGAGHEGQASEEGHEGTHAHHVSIFQGVSHNTHLDEASFTVGASYRYALTDRFAIGPIAEFAFFESEDTRTFLAAAYWKPVGELLLLAGPGVEFIDPAESAHEEESSSGGHAKSVSTTHESASGTESKFAFRVGGGYEIHIGRATLMPLVAADFVDGHTTMVYGADLGIGF